MKFTSVKVSNNALNFLLAQYRAIFKRAYIKGIASAVLLTAGLAAGASQANAAAPDPAKGEYWQYEGSDWSVTSGATSDVDGIVAASVASQEKSTTSSGAVLTIGGDVANSLQTVTSGTVAGGWASFDSGNAFALSNEVKVLGSGSVTRGDADVGTRGSIIGGYAKSAQGKAEASGNIISVAKGETYRDKAATSHGFMGGKAQGLTGATANKNQVIVKGALGSLQTLGIAHLHDVVGGYVMTAEAPNASEATGDYVANENIVDLQYVKAQGLTSDDNRGNDASLGIYGGHFSVYTDNAIKATADQNIVKITASEFSTADNSSGTHVIAGVRNRMGDQNGGATSLNFTNNAVTLADTKITSGSSFTGSFTVAGAYATGLAPSISATGNSVTLTETGTTNTLAISDVAGAYVNSSVKTADGLTIVATGNKVTVGKNVTLTLDDDGVLAGAHVLASGAAIQSLKASNNSVSIAGTVHGDVAAFKLKSTNGTVEANVVDASNNVVTLNDGATVDSGSIIAGEGPGSAINIESGSTYKANTTNNDLISDIINIDGNIEVAQDKALNIKGYYADGDPEATTFNANLTTVSDTAKISNSGTINVYGKMVVDEDATLVATSGGAVLKIDDSKAIADFKSDVEGAGYGHLAIYKDTLKTYLNGSDAIEDSDSGAVVVSGGTLEFLGSKQVDLANDFILSGGTTAGAGKISVSGATIMGENLAVSNVLATDLASDAKGLKLDATKLTLGATDYTGTTTLGFESATAENLEVKASGAFTLADTITLSTSGSGSITGDLKIGTDGSLTISAGTYKGGSIESTVDNGLTVAADSSLALSTLGASTAAGAVVVNGTLSAENAKLGVADSVTINKDAVLSFGSGATSAITLTDDADGADGALKVDTTVFADGALNLSGGEVQFAFASGDIFDSKALTELRAELFGVDSGLVDGFINLGEGKIEGIDASSGSVAWDDIADYSDIIADITTGDLKQATVTGITAGDQVQGNVGSLQASGTGTDAITVTGNTVLNNASGENNAFASNANGEVVGITVENQTNLTLNEGGQVGTITMNSTSGSTFTVNSVASSSEDTAGTVIGSTETNGKGIDAKHSEVVFAKTSAAATGETTVNGSTEAAVLTTSANTVTTFNGEVTIGKGVSSDSQFKNQGSTLNGATVFKENATFAQNATIAAQADFGKDVTFASGAAISANTTVGGTLTADAGLSVESGATIVAETLDAQGTVFIGTDGADDSTSGSAGTLMVNKLSLNNGDLIVDPDWGEGLSFVSVKDFDDDSQNKYDAGILTGNAYTLRNSILAVGLDKLGSDESYQHAKDEVTKLFAQYIDNGNLTSSGVGAVMYVAENFKVAQDFKLVVDPTVTLEATQTAFDSAKAKYKGYDVYLDGNGVLAVEVSAATGDQAAITFAPSDNKVDIKAADKSKIVITGDYKSSDTLTLFASETGTIEITGNVSSKNDGTMDGILVETLNGLLSTTYTGQDIEVSKMDLNLDAAKTAYTDASAPVRNSILAYVAGDTDWANQGKEGHDIEESRIHGAQATGYICQNEGGTITFYKSSDGETAEGAALTADEVKKLGLTYVKTMVEEEPAQGTQTKALTPKYTAYYVAQNDFLTAVREQTETSGAAAESAARMADFAGVAQVALKAGASTYEAISGRMGMGAENTSMTFANNGQGAGIWLTPIYQTSDSDGFEAQGVDYGADIDLYGIALGGDYTLANGVRVGAMFNVGSGEADGQGAGSAVSNDFDYYGFGLYAGYTMGQFSVVGDISYTAVDNDVEANTNIDKLETSLDSSNLSLGVTGAYAFETAAGIEVTPHVGLRYSYIDIDDYSVKGKTTGNVGDYSADSLSVFSIPVGVTIASEFQAGSWSVKPSFDITLTGNFGDDENEGTFHWTGVENIDSSLTSEIFDNFTYGASLGVAAQSTSGISLGLTVGYTGSSNVDDLGVSANARFTF